MNKIGRSVEVIILSIIDIDFQVLAKRKILSFKIEQKIITFKWKLNHSSHNHQSERSENTQTVNVGYGQVDNA